MKIRMLTHYSRSTDGIHVTHYNIGQKYDLPDEDAYGFIAIGVAVEDKELVLDTKAGNGECEDNYAGIYVCGPPGPQKFQKKRRK